MADGKRKPPKKGRRGEPPYAPDYWDRVEVAARKRRAEHGLMSAGSAFLLRHEKLLLTPGARAFIRDECSTEREKAGALRLMERGDAKGCFCPRCGLTVREIRRLTAYREKMGLVPVVQPCAPGPTNLSDARKKRGDTLDRDGVVKVGEVVMTKGVF